MSAPAALLLLLSQAGQALERCDLAETAAQTAALAAADPQSSALYRLAWLERAEGARRLEIVSDRERWRDEAPPAPVCGRSPRPVLFSRLPEDVVREALEPWVPRYAEARAPLREVLRAYLTWRWLKGERRHLPEVPPIGDLSARCEWSALRFLNDGSPLDAECAHERGPFWAIAGTAEGDALLSAGRAEEALPRYRAAIENLPDREIDPKLWYRVGVAAALGGGEDDLALRSLARVLPDEDRPLENGKDKTPLSPVDLDVARNLACERLGEVRASVLRRIFVPEALLDGLLKVGASCPSTVVRLGRELAPSFSPGARARWKRMLQRLTRTSAHAHAHGRAAPVAEVGGLRADSLHATSAVAIPLSLSPPPVIWQIEPEAEFLRAFETDALALARSESPGQSQEPSR